MKIVIREKPWDLAVVIGLAICVLIVVWLEQTGIVRVVLGILYVLFLPGYALTAALFPKKKSIDTIERIALSIGLSIAVGPLVGLVLNYTPYGITLDSIVIALFIVIVCCAVVGWYRRVGLPPEDRFCIELTIALPSQKFTTLDKALVVIIVALVVSACVLVYLIVMTPRIGERYTEFYVLNENRKAENYPKNLTTGKVATVVIGIVNHEYKPTTYTLEIILFQNNTTAPAVVREFTNWTEIHTFTPQSGINYSISLEHNAKWENMFRFNVSVEGNYRLQFYLYRTGIDKTPYWETRLWLKVLP